MKTSFIDILMIMLLVFVLLPHKPDTSQQDETHAGDLVVEISWPDCQDSDVDLWVKSPTDKPVGYSRLRGKDVSLLRDDLGNHSGCARGELAASRVLTDGEWIVNVHLYGDRAGAAPFLVHVYVWYRKGDARVVIWSGTVRLDRAGQEVTAVRWTMAGGAFLPGSIHYSPAKLRAAAGSVQ